MLGCDYGTHARFIFRSSSFSPAIPCAGRYLPRRRAADGIYSRKSLWRECQAGVLWGSKPSGPCDSVVGRLAVSLASDGVWAGWSRRFEGCSRPSARAGPALAVRIDALAAAERTFPPRFWGKRCRLAGLGSGGAYGIMFAARVNKTAKMESADNEALRNRA